jgi:hypothetical protein
MPLYPKVHVEMSDPEKAMAYQQNKTALASTNLDQRTRILALAKRLDLMLTAESSLANWEQKRMKNRANFKYLFIILWHDPKGNPINNTATAVDPAILLPVQDGTRTQCHSAGVKFVRVQLSLDFAILGTIPAATNTALCGEYYIQLSQSTVQLTNTVGSQYNLNTFQGPSDIRTLLLDKF